MPDPRQCCEGCGRQLPSHVVDISTLSSDTLRHLMSAAQLREQLQEERKLERLMLTVDRPALGAYRSPAPLRSEHDLEIA